MKYKYLGTEEQLIENQKMLNEKLKPFLEAKIKIIQNSIPMYIMHATETETIYNKETQQLLDTIDNEIYNIKETHKNDLMEKYLVEVEDDSLCD